VKCPKCGYVSFPGLRECKKCGHTFSRTADRQDPPASPSPPHLEQGRFVPPEPGRAFETPLPSQGTAEGFLPGNIARCESPAQSAAFLQPQKAVSAEPGWAGEVTGRAANFKRDRSGLRKTPERVPNLQFDFDATEKAEPNPTGFKGAWCNDFLDRPFENPSLAGRPFNLESIPLRRSPERKTQEGAAAITSSGMANAPGELAGTPQPKRVASFDATLDSSGSESILDEIKPAPLRKRFLAGMADAVILLIAGCIFGTLFSLVNGKLQYISLDLVVVGFIAVFWIFIYFGAFTALTLSTPGQAALGLGVRNLDGDPPTRQEAFLRAFGYLVSLMAFMVGFLWAAMDSDGMAWHDHISGTILVEND
jgi:uncharacterized RDD family membrane protein YckC